MMAGHWRTRRRLLMGLSGAIILLGILSGWAVYLINTSGGPIAAKLQVQKGGYYVESSTGFVNQTSTFTGYFLNNHTESPEKILSISPTNVPPHTRLRVGLKDHPPAVGVSLKWTAPLKPIPKTLDSTPKRAVGVIPTVLMRANKPGVYVINGFSLTYRWNHSVYQTYLPDQFVLCVGSHHLGVCPHHIAPPPQKRIWSWPRAWHLLMNRL